MQPGCYSGYPEAEYHASEGLSVSRLKRHRKAALLSTVEQDEETRDQKLGTLIHCVALEPDSFAKRFVINDDNRNSNAFKAVKAKADADGKEVVKQQDYDNARRIRDAIMAHPEAGRILAPGPSLLVEQSFYWVDPATGILCRGRADAIRLDWRAIGDLKSTEDASAEGFARSCTKYLYDWQQAYYQEGIEASCGWMPEAFFFIAVEKKPPFLVKPWVIHPDDVDRAYDEVCEARAHYRRCLDAGHFPGLGNDVGTLRIGFRTPANYIEPSPEAAPETVRLIAA